MLDTIAGALARLGVDRALVVAGEDGLDEISISSPTWVVEVNGDHLTRSTLTPADVGLQAVDEATELAECAGGTPEHNAPVTRAIVAGERGPRRDVAVINAGAAIYAAGIAGTLADGVVLAQRALDDGSATRTLDAFVAATHEPVDEASSGARR